MVNIKKREKKRPAYVLAEIRTEKEEQEKIELIIKREK